MFEMKAKRNTIVAAAAAFFMIAEFVGCKSAPKMPWSKTATTSDVSASALAHSAPSLPADIAKQAEAFASASPSIETSAPSSPMSGDQAPAYSSVPPYSSTAPAYSPSPASVAAAPTPSQALGAMSAPTAYPSTGASPYTATAAATMAASAQPNGYVFDQSANLGMVDTPYNPSAVPPAKTVAAVTPENPTDSADRYGKSTAASTPPAYGGSSAPPVNTASTPQLSGSDRYGSFQQTTATPTTSPVPSVNLASTDSQAPSTTNASAYNVSPNAGGDRYAANSDITPTPANVTQNLASTSAPVIASTSTYRPGGTTSYQGSAANEPTVSIASRPELQVPNVGIPGAAPAQSQAPLYR